MTMPKSELMSARRSGGFPSRWSTAKKAQLLRQLGYELEATKVPSRRTKSGLTKSFEVVGYGDLVNYQTTDKLRANGLMAKVCAELGMPTLEEEAAAKAKAKKTSEARFTCQVCGGEYKTIEGSGHLRHGRVVLHGYQRPGWGYTVGRCGGEGHVPFEVSSDRTKVFLGELRDIEAGMVESLTKAQAEVSKRAVAYEGFDWSARDAKLDALRAKEGAEKAERQLARGLRCLRRDIKTTETRLDGWTATHRADDAAQVRWVEKES